MKKRFPFFCVMASAFLLTALRATSQTGSVGIGVANPHPSSVLELASNSKGLLIPRMTQGQRDAIASPISGLLIYQTDGIPGFYYFNLNAWQLLGSGTGANRSLSNLETVTAVNTHLLPSGSGVWALGSAGNGWRDLYLTANAYFQGNRTISVYGTNNFFGTLAGNPSITGDNNVGIGPYSLSNFVSGNWNTSMGYQSLLFANNSFSNTAMGFQSMYANSTGGLNTGIGVLTLSSNATGSSNTAVGESAGRNLLNGNGNTYLGALANSPVGTQLFNAAAIGAETMVTASNTMRFGNSAVTSIGGQVNWTAFSDGRFKKDVRENIPGLAFINQLRPVTYHLDVNQIDDMLKPKIVANEDLQEAAKQKAPSNEDLEAKRAKAAVLYSGFIAQEVENAANKLGYRFSGVDAPKNGADFYGLRYAEFVVPLVKAVQELSQQMETVKRENESVKADRGSALKEIATQKQQLSKQQTEIDTLKQIVHDLQKQVTELQSKEK